MEKSLATPEQSQSSVFMTPSSSVSKPLYQAPRPLVLTPLPLSLLSPAATPKGQCMDLPPSPPENLDILSELYMRGLPHVSQQILAYLAPPDLCRSLHVCRTWQQQISLNEDLKEKIMAYRRQCKESAENLEKVYKAIPVMAVAPTQRKALATIAPNIMLKTHSTKPAPFPQSFPLRSTQKHRPCPNCQSPAKELNLRRAQCSKCQFDFCQHCFKPWHKGECRGRVSPGKRPRQSESLCCTKKSRKRLHRL